MGAEIGMWTSWDPSSSVWGTLQPAALQIVTSTDCNQPPEMDVDSEISQLFPIYIYIFIYFSSLLFCAGPLLNSTRGCSPMEVLCSHGDIISSKYWFRTFPASSDVSKSKCIMLFYLAFPQASPSTPLCWSVIESQWWTPLCSLTKLLYLF